MISGAYQTQIENVIRTASPDQLRAIKTAAETTLHVLSRRADDGLLDPEENTVSETAIEFIARIEALEHGGGLWFRLKRRAELLQIYFGSGGAVHRPHQVHGKTALN
jgi:hypothetical protein